jgi:hypothetical protein
MAYKPFYRPFVLDNLRMTWQQFLRAKGRTKDDSGYR